MTNGSNSSTEGVVGIDDRFGRRAVAAVELRQVVKEALFGEAAELVVNRLGDGPFERDVQRLPALIIVLERLGEVTGSYRGIIGGPLDAVALNGPVPFSAPPPATIRRKMLVQPATRFFYRARE